MLVKEKKQRLCFQHQELILFIYLVSTNYNIIQKDLKSIVLTLNFNVFNYNDNKFKKYTESSFYNGLLSLEEFNIIERNEISKSNYFIQLKNYGVLFCQENLLIEKKVNITKQNKRNTNRDLYNVSEKCKLILKLEKYSLNGFYDLKDLLSETSIFTKFYNLNEFYYKMNEIYKFYDLSIKEEKEQFENELIFNKEFLFDDRKKKYTLYSFLNSNIYIIKMKKSIIRFYFSLPNTDTLCLDDIRKITQNNVDKINHFYNDVFVGTNRNVKLEIQINLNNRYTNNISKSLNRKYKNITFTIS